MQSKSLEGLLEDEWSFYQKAQTNSLHLFLEIAIQKHKNPDGKQPRLPHTDASYDPRAINPQARI